ncbi:MAG: hypothetical protein Q7J57_08190 [Gemmobacter sp.]|nr:hypothetical protein [Gemmobacter sp.]
MFALTRRPTLAIALPLTTALTLPAAALVEQTAVFAAASFKNALDAIAIQRQAKPDIRW